MFGNQKKTLEKKYQQRLEESYRLSHSNRRQSDIKRTEAEEVAAQLDHLDGKEQGQSRRSSRRLSKRRCDGKKTFDADLFGDCCSVDQLSLLETNGS